MRSSIRKKWLMRSGSALKSISNHSEKFWSTRLSATPTKSLWWNRLSRTSATKEDNKLCSNGRSKRVNRKLRIRKLPCIRKTKSVYISNQSVKKLCKHSECGLKCHLISNRMKWKSSILSVIRKHIRKWRAQEKMSMIKSWQRSPIKNGRRRSQKRSVISASLSVWRSVDKKSKSSKSEQNVDNSLEKCRRGRAQVVKFCSLMVWTRIWSS